jgi:hypothetical protein
LRSRDRGKQCSYDENKKRADIHEIKDTSHDSILLANFFKIFPRVNKTLAEQQRDTSSRCELSPARWDEASPERRTHKNALAHEPSLLDNCAALLVLVE